jgi:acyl-CoA thioester hydrolase
MTTRWGDCDSQGHLDNAVYYSWFDTTRTMTLIAPGAPRSGARNSIGLCIENHYDFLALIHFPKQ